MIPPATTARARNAAATREAMLASARRRFALENYENVGLRDIAGDVGVDPALIVRYFGGKEALFKECLRAGDEAMLHGVSREALPAHLAGMLLDGEQDPCGYAQAKVEKLLILLRSASSPKAAQMIRESISEDLIDPIAETLGGGDDAGLRASLCFATLMGMGILHTAMRVDAVCTCDEAMVRARLEALFRAALGD